MIYSNAIGDGEIGVAPIQMANLAAIIANRGWYRTPHFVKAVGDSLIKDQRYIRKNYTAVESKYFEPVISAMESVVVNGTARNAVRHRSSCVKEEPSYCNASIRPFKSCLSKCRCLGIFFNAMLAS